MALCVITPIFYTKHIAVFLVMNPMRHKCTRLLLLQHGRRIRGHKHRSDVLSQNLRLCNIADIHWKLRFGRIHVALVPLI
jgi:hypothetical protein